MGRSPSLARFAFLALVTIVGACSRARCSGTSIIAADRVDARPEAGDSWVDAPPPTFTSDLRGRKLLHAFGTARPEQGGLAVRITTEETHCDSSVDSGGRVLDLHLPSGPEGDFLAGHAVNVSVGLWPEPGNDSNALTFGATAATLTLDRFSLEVGARVRGTLSFDDRAKPPEEHSGAGTFDVELCGDAQGAPPKPAIVDAARLAAPLSGTMDGTPFHPRSALGIRYRAYADTFVDAIYFFENAGVTCAQANSTYPPGRWIELTDVGGTVKGRTLSGTQVAVSAVAPAGDVGTNSATSRATAWIEWTDLVDGHVRGRAWATNGTTWNDSPYAFEIAGTFDVDVCR